jgi:hypothetical protein
MSRRGFTESAALLHDLLDRFEAKPAVNRHLAYVDYDGFPSISHQDRMIRALELIEREGGVDMMRRRVDGVDGVAHVRLADPEVVYRHLDRQPAAISVDQALLHLRLRSDLPPSAAAALDDLASAWTRGVSRFTLGAGDAGGLAEAVELALALHRRASDPTSILMDYRTFSRMAGVRSKALEERAAAVVALFDRFYSGMRESGLDTADALATFGVTRLPQPLLLSGPLMLDGAPLPSTGYVGVPPEEGDRLGIAQTVSYVLSIENYAPFVRHAREINADRTGLVFYTGGFPARPILKQIVRLAAQARAPTFHWGDMDSGGVRIFRHLEDSMAAYEIALQPHMMDVELLSRCGAPTGIRSGLQAGACPRSAIAKLWDHIAATSLGHEQESFAPSSPTIRPFTRSCASASAAGDSGRAWNSSKPRSGDR